MFHIQGLDGIQFNISLEDLRHNEKVNKLNKGYAARKIIEKNEGQYREPNDNGILSHAVKAYKEAIKISNDREPILHAYTIMKFPVLTLNPEISVTDAWNFLKEKGVSHMPVLSKENKIIGILSDKDLLEFLCIIDCNKKDIALKTVVDVMTKKVITSGKFTDIRRIAKAMFENHIGTMPIVDESGYIIGIVTRSDILYALVNYPPLSLWI
ncbi:MAG: CBS domain-containing protein [Spirochaetes bacterium]|nr:CBS domain-containing protein [Spirochaetota bacterium]